MHPLTTLRTGSTTVVIVGCVVAGMPGFAPAQEPATRVVTGVVRGSVSGRPISEAAVLIESASLYVATGPDGRFVLRGVPRSAVLLRTMAIGYRPMRHELGPGTDSVDVQLAIQEPRSHSPVSSVLPPFDVTERRAIWTALLRGLARADEGAGDHFQEVARAVPGSRIEAPSGSAGVVLHVPAGRPAELDDARWHRALGDRHTIDGVCRAGNAIQCPQAGFKLFATPSQPGRFASDSVTVRVNFTILDAGLCRQGRGMGDSGTEWHLVVRTGGQWHYAGEDDSQPRMLGGLYCGVR